MGPRKRDYRNVALGTEGRMSVCGREETWWRRKLYLSPSWNIIFLVSQRS